MPTEHPIADEEEIKPLLDEWEKWNKQRRRIYHRFILPCFVIGLPGFVWGVQQLMISICSSPGESLTNKFPVFVVSTLLVFAGGYAHTNYQERIVRLTEQIWSLNDIRFLPCLLEMHRTAPLAHPAPVTLILTRLLRQVKASDSNLLNAAQKMMLYTGAARLPTSFSGKPHQRLELNLAMVKAIEQIGDEKAVPFLNALIENDWESTTLTPAARIALEAVTQRTEQTKDSRMLLRAASDNDNSTLLKPAMPTDAEEDSLLRPAE